MNLGRWIPSAGTRFASVASQLVSYFGIIHHPFDDNDASALKPGYMPWQVTMEAEPGGGALVSKQWGSTAEGGQG
ncbi:hypothetical protein UVI_02061520 [Ustilaginoidea virens]|uniref:Uncharacterized protein n=1 Tax=Ustilaginoidea virens TaxID=1159556 RepID=A0A1B5L7R8_USTVR|nr:hypothetical protein UVI_02061520 [Ustilaginoidea virens]